MVIVSFCTRAMRGEEGLGERLVCGEGVSERVDSGLRVSKSHGVEMPNSRVCPKDQACDGLYAALHRQGSPRPRESQYDQKPHQPLCHHCSIHQRLLPAV
jgi:hypothetical protein